MSKAEILHELPGLLPEERREIFERICELQERDLLNGVGPAPDEKKILDHELDEYQKNPGAGSSWEDVESRLRGRSPR